MKTEPKTDKATRLMIITLIVAVITNIWALV